MKYWVVHQTTQSRAIKQLYFFYLTAKSFTYMYIRAYKCTDMHVWKCVFMCICVFAWVRWCFFSALFSFFYFLLLFFWKTAYWQLLDGLGLVWVSCVSWKCCWTDIWCCVGPLRSSKQTAASENAVFLPALLLVLDRITVFKDTSIGYTVYFAIISK